MAAKIIFKPSGQIEKSVRRFERIANRRFYTNTLIIIFRNFPKNY